MQWEALVSGAEASNEVVLEGSYGSFSCIDSVHSWWGELAVNVGLFREFFEGFRAFIVENMKMRFAASESQHVVDILKGSHYVVGTAVWDGSDMNGVAVAVAGYRKYSCFLGWKGLGNLPVRYVYTFPAWVSHTVA